jgi:hypothetical protein
MPSITGAFASFLRPGSRVVESTEGYRVLEIASHSTVYLLGSASLGDYHTPTLVRSLVDFTNQFGGSPSEAAIRVLFKNNASAVVYFVRAAIAKVTSIVIDAATSGNAYAVTVDGVEVSVGADGTATPTSVRNALMSAINASSSASKVTAFPGASGAALLIRSDDGTAEIQPVVAKAGTGAGQMTLTDATPVSSAAPDYVAAIGASFDVDDEWPQGFLIAPEAFQRLTLASDRLAVGTAMQDHCADTSFDWKCVVDCGPDNDTLAEYQADGLQYSTPQGHLDWLAPYLVTTEGDLVPASAAAVGMATRRFAEEGYHQPYAGARYALRGVTDVAYKFGGQDQDVLNPNGLNVVRKLRNKGVCVWALRSRSGDSFYRQSTTRVVMNVLNGTLRAAFDFDLFTSIDSVGVLMGRIEETANSVCRRMWRAGALYGRTEPEAFECRCSLENNTDDGLELGQLILEVWAAPAPGLEKLLIGTVRVPVGQVQASAAAGFVTAA